uniref:Uncharacterized protein n=1 Tax=Panstrongylus lignarius TaxID=156445 RepID=A0A224XRW9_9HEMI
MLESLSTLGGAGASCIVLVLNLSRSACLLCFGVNFSFGPALAFFKSFSTFSSFSLTSFSLLLLSDLITYVLYLNFPSSLRCLAVILRC